jgi:exonuclease SbcD
MEGAGAITKAFEKAGRLRFVHLADLHIGRSLGEIDLIDDQRRALESVVRCVGRVRPDAVLVAGDVYDKSTPSERAVELADDFFTALTDLCGAVCVIGGNHDSQERLSFARRILFKRGLYIAGSYQGRMERVECADAALWLMPFFRPREAAPLVGPFEPMTFDGAVRAALSREKVDPARVNVLLAHQFVVAGQGEEETSESEMELTSVGGAEMVNVRAFDAFDYVALGHLHAPQRVGRDGVRYAGSLLKYSASEARHVKSVVVGEVTQGGLSVSLEPVCAPRDLRVVKGTLEALTSPVAASAGNREDLMHVTLTDPLLSPDALSRLRQYYPNIFRMEYAPPDAGQRALNRRRALSAREMFREFYRDRTGADLDDAMAEYMDEVFDEAGREGAQ